MPVVVDGIIKLSGPALNYTETKNADIVGVCRLVVIMFIPRKRYWKLANRKPNTANQLAGRAKVRIGLQT